MNTTTNAAVFNPVTFSVREEPLLVMARYSVTGGSDRFIKDFGSTWKKIPGHPLHRFIGNTEKQLYATLWMGDADNPPSVAIYSGIAIDKFKEAFLKDLAMDYYHDVIVLENGVMYAGGKVMMEMTARGLWK